MALRWRIYYADGNAVRSDELEPQRVPRRLVIGVVQEVPGSDKPKEIFGGDVYLWRGYGWTAADHFGLYDYLMHHDGQVVVLAGWTERDDTFREVGVRMHKEGLG